MLFNSWQFVLFFPVVTILYFRVRSAGRVPLLLAASCLFYMAFVPRYILIIFALIAVDYVAAMLIGRAAGARRRSWLIVSIVANVGILAIFKYLGFLGTNVDALLARTAVGYRMPILAMVLPIGLSFHTFQSLAYTIEVYYGRWQPEVSLPRYALYVLFYPQLVAGPIERPQHLLPQLTHDLPFDLTDFKAGMLLIVWGLFKKMVVADRLALMVDGIYSNGQANGPELLFATVCFAFQIYYDFSGYTDIAIGAARVMRIRLVTNFNRPYTATSVAEFWHRWHISLSTWFRDYVYIPLGGSRKGPWRTRVNILFVFLLSGLWHGAAWRFVVWGLLHGLFVVVGGLTRSTRAKWVAISGLESRPALRRIVAQATTFGLVSFAWIFFRAPDTTAAFVIVGRLFGGWRAALRGGWLPPTHFQTSPFAAQAVLVTALIVVVELLSNLEAADLADVPFARRPVLIRWMVYVSLATAVLDFGVFKKIPFLYFQF